MPKRNVTVLETTSRGRGNWEIIRIVSVNVLLVLIAEEGCVQSIQLFECRFSLSG